MTYGIKYKAEIKDRFGDDYELQILERNYLGADSEMFLTADNPIMLEYPGDEMDVFRAIYGSQLIINAVATIDFQYVSLHSADGRKYKVRLLKNTVLFWEGWLLPDLHNEPYTAPPYMVQITARCGLGELNSIPMPMTVLSYIDGDSTVKGKTFVNLYSAITHCLRQINPEMDIKESVNIYNAERLTPPIFTDTTLTDTYIDLASFEGLSMYEFLTDILNSFGSRIYQQDGYWWVIRLKEYREALKTRTLAVNGSGVLGYDNTKLTTFLVGKPQQNYILNNSPEMKINPAWKSFELNQKKQKIVSLLKNYDFSETVILNIEYSETRRNTPRVTLAPGSWERVGIIGADRIGTCYIEENRNNNWNKYIYQDFHLNASENQGLRVEIDCVPIAQSYSSPSVQGVIPNGAGSRTKFAFGLNQVEGSSIKYAYYNDFGFGKWEDAINNVIVIPDVEVVGVQEKRFNTHTVIFRGIPLTGRIRFAIFGAQNFQLAVKEVRITLVEILNPADSDPKLILKEYPESISEEIIINENNSYIGKEVELIGCDLPDIINSEYIWRNGYRDVLNKRTRIWNEFGETIEKGLTEYLKDDYRQMFLLPQWVLTLPILSQSIKFDSSIVDYQILPKKYQCVSASIDIRAGIFTGVFAEIGAWEGSPWILADGTWNDNGIWIDSEVWNDGE